MSHLVYSVSGGIGGMGGKMEMDRFVAVKKWDDKERQRIRQEFKKAYLVDLDEFLPSDEDSIVQKWKEVVDLVFGEKRYSIDFELLKDILQFTVKNLDKEAQNCFIDAINRYEVYEPDVWINAYFNMGYLSAKSADVNGKNRIKGIASDYASNVEFALPFDREIQLDFCRGYKETIYHNNVVKVFDTDIPKHNDWRELSQSTRDKMTILDKYRYCYENINITRWTWFKTLRLENSGRFQLEDKILFQKTIAGDYARRLIQYLHTQENVKAHDYYWIRAMGIIRLRSFSWQRLMIALLTYTEDDIFLNDVNYCFHYSEGGDNITIRWLNDFVFLADHILKEKIAHINQRCDLLVAGLIYLCMCNANKACSEKWMKELHSQAEKAYNALFSMDSCDEIKKVWNLEREKRISNISSESHLIYLSDLTEQMISDLCFRRKKDVRSYENCYEKLTENEVFDSKIVMMKEDKSLTAEYAMLQRGIIMWCRDVFKENV